MRTVLEAHRQRDEQRTSAALRALLSLATQVLMDARGSKGAARRVAARIERLEAGLPVADEAARYQAQGERRRQRVADIAQAKRVSNQLALGSVTRAAQALVRSKVADPTDEVIATLRRLHPVRDPPQVPETQQAAASIDAAAFSALLEALPRGSAAGPSGWTYEHIRAAAEANESCSEAIRELLNTVISGELPQLPELLASTLIPFEKPTGGVRPIAVGEVWFRLAGLCALSTCREVGLSLAPLQQGVGVAGGAQNIGHALEAATASDPELVVVQLDFANAFNTLDRTAMLHAVAERAPALLPLATWAYSKPSELLLRDAPAGMQPIVSAAGVRQGDPLGPLFYSLTTYPALQTAAAAHPDAHALAYLDDTFQVARAGPIVAAVRAFLQAVQPLGLQEQLPKCCVWSRTPDRAAEVAAALGMHHCADGLVATGTPIGTPDFVAAHAMQRAEAACAMVDTLEALPLQGQHRLILATRSLQKKLTHLARCVPWQQIEAAITQLERRTEDVLLGLAGTERDSVPAECLVQMGLPLRHGGLGLEQFDAHKADAALVAGAAVAQAALTAAPELMQPFSWHGPRGAELARRVAHVIVAGGGGIDEGLAAMDEAVIRHQLPRLQQAYGRVDADRTAAALLGHFDPGTAQGATALARLRSCAGAGPSAWLEAMPTGRWSVFSNIDLRFGLRFRLGLDTMPAGAIGTQCACGRHLQPDDADHAMTCSATGGAGTMRHDHVNNVWCHLAYLAGVSSSREPTLRTLQRRAQADGRAVRRAGQENDGAVANQAAGPSNAVPAATPAAGPSADGHEDGAHQPPADDAAADTVEDAPGARAGGPANAGLRKGDGARGDAIMTLPEGTIVADVSVIHPAAQTYIGVAARATGAAAALRDASKVEKYRRSAMGGACEFVPLSVETYGRMGEPAMALLRRLAEVAADGGRVNKQRWMKSALRKLSVALMRGNSWRFKAGLSVGARVAGRSFQAGLVRPAVEGG